MKIASIDIGTNTCNFTIAQTTSNNKIIILHKSKRPIKLIDNEYYNNRISESAIKRCINALKEYKKTIQEYGVDKYIAVATSGIRNAVNSNEIIVRIKEEADFIVEVISGQKEAFLAYKGVKNAINLYNKPSLVIDIGGGSVEFIICNNHMIIWKSSYPIGIARIIKKHYLQDPLTNDNVNFLNALFKMDLSEVVDKANEYNVTTLIGSSGSFDTLKNLIICSFTKEIPDEHQSYYQINPKSFQEIHKRLISSDIFERLEMKGMDPIRVEMIPIASVLINFIINKLKIRKIYQSGYSIKEGLIFDYIKKTIKT